MSCDSFVTTQDNKKQKTKSKQTKNRSKIRLLYSCNIHFRSYPHDDQMLLRSPSNNVQQREFQNWPLRNIPTRNNNTPPPWKCLLPLSCVMTFEEVVPHPCAMTCSRLLGSLLRSTRVAITRSLAELQGPSKHDKNRHTHHRRRANVCFACHERS